MFKLCLCPDCRTIKSRVPINIALIYPSLWEGFGFLILEAASQGAPVITSNKTAMREIGHEYAELVNPLDVEDIRAALDTVYTMSSDELSNLAVRGRILTGKDSRENFIDRHLVTYDQVFQTE